MQKTILIGALAAVGAFTGVAFNGSRGEAADEIRCRVNVEAFLKDFGTLKAGQPEIDKDFVNKLLQSKKP